MSRSGITRLLTSGGIGDAILLTPSLRALRQQRPAQKLIVWVPHPGQECVLRHNPNIDRIVRVGGVAGLLYQATGAGRWLPLVQTNYGRLMPALLYSQRAASLIGEMLGVEIGNCQPELFLQEHELCAAAALLAPLEAPVVVVHVQGACSPNKNWPIESWNSLVAGFPEVTFVQVGAPGEPTVQGARDLRGIPLRHAFAVLQQATAFIGVDSSMAHAASALNTPGLVLFGPSSPTVWGHDNQLHLYTKRYCSPCIDVIGAAPCPFGRACMNEITVEVAHESVTRLLRSAKETALGAGASA